MLNDSKNITKAKAAAYKAKDQYVKDLGVYRIQTYVAAKNADTKAQERFKDTAASLADDPTNSAKITEYTNSKVAAKTTADALASAESALKSDVQGVINTTTPVTPTTPVVPTTPSDNNPTTNNNTQAQTLYVSYSEHPTLKVATLNDNGVYTDNYVAQNTPITVMQSKTVNGELLYKIADNQWILAKYTAKQANASTEEAVSGLATLNEVPGHPSWKINMLDASGHYTNVYLNANTAWKVFGKKTINGEVCYRLSSQSQWVPTNYLSLTELISQKEHIASAIYFLI